MTTLATITSKNQLTIPREITEALDLEQVKRVLISVKEGNLVIKPLVSRIDILAGSLSYLSSGKQSDLKKVREKTQQKVAAEIAKEGT